MFALIADHASTESSSVRRNGTPQCRSSNNFNKEVADDISRMYSFGGEAIALQHSHAGKGSVSVYMSVWSYDKHAHRVNTHTNARKNVNPPTPPTHLSSVQNCAEHVPNRKYRYRGASWVT